MLVSKYVRRTLIGVACGLSLASVCAPTASADSPSGGGKTLVVLGDSYSANGDVKQLLDAVGEKFTGRHVQTCLPEPSSWPNQLVEQMALPTADVVNTSCGGASLTSGGMVAVRQARDAANAGAFGPRTKLVTIQFGLNDMWGKTRKWFGDMLPCLFDLIHGCGTEVIAAGQATDPASVTGAEYVNRISQVVDYIRYYAPNARIVFVGYPELHAQGSDALCFDAFGGRVVQPRAGAWTSYLDAVNSAQRAAAAVLNVAYVDTPALTRGHGTCSADPWVNGFLSPNREVNGMLWHPTQHGDAMVATALRESFMK